MRNSIFILLALVGVACAAQTPTTSFQKVSALCKSKTSFFKCKNAKVKTKSGKNMSPCAWTGKKKEKKCTIKACDSFAKKPSCVAAPYCTWRGKQNVKCVENVDVESDTEDACEALKEELEEQTALVAEADAKTKTATLSAQKAKADADASRKYAEEMEAEADKAKGDAAASSKYAKEMKSEADEAKAEAAASSKNAEEMKAEADKANAEADASSKYAEEMKSEADKANAEADASRKYAEEMEAEADKANAEADASSKYAEEMKAEAEAANAELEFERERAERGDAEIAYLKGRSNGLLKIPHWIAQSLNHDASMMYMNPDLLATGGDDAFLILAHVLMNGVPSLQRIRFQNCKLNDTDALALAVALPSLPGLIGIYLDYNDIGDAGAAALSETLAHLPVLERVHLKYNKIGNVGAQAFADAVANGEISDTLKYIYLTAGNSIDDEMKYEVFDDANMIAERDILF